MKAKTDKLAWTHQPANCRWRHLIVIQLLVLRHSGDEGSHAGDACHHLVHDVVEIATVVIIQRGIKGHFVAVKDQLDLKQWGDALRRLRVVYQVLQGAAHGAAEACQNHAVHVVGVGLPLTAVQVCHAEEALVLLQQRKKKDESVARILRINCSM